MFEGEKMDLPRLTSIHYTTLHKKCNTLNVNL
jgi:hypothetical protein